VVGLVVVLFVAGRGGGGLLGNPAVTEENYDKLASGMTRTEIESILGPGSPVREIAQPRVIGLANELSFSEWRNGSNEIKVGYLKSPTHGDVCFHASFSKNEPGGGRSTIHFQQVGPPDVLRAGKLARDRNKMK
jgi:hypothetical protein